MKLRKLTEEQFDRKLMIIMSMVGSIILLSMFTYNLYQNKQNDKIDPSYDNLYVNPTFSSEYNISIDCGFVNIYLTVNNETIEFCEWFKENK